MIIENLPIAIAQLDFLVGDIEGNAEKITKHYQMQADNGAAIIVFPECAITGYPAEDLLLLPHFQDAAMQAIQELANITCKYECALVVGGIWCEDEQLFNVAFWLEDGAIQRIFRKISLPNDGVFDERRTFAASVESEIMEWRGLRISVIICEDMWHPRRMSYQFLNNTDLCIVINASPFEQGKLERRYEVAKRLSAVYPHPLIYVNMVGGQDEIVFDGGSFCLDKNGNLTHQLTCFAEDVRIIHLNDHNIIQLPEPLEAIYEALQMGLKSYIHKNGFERVLLGLSGGIDSALVAVIAADALGAENVHCVMLPSPYNAAISMEDAMKLVHNLGVRHSILPINLGMSATDEMLSPLSHAITSSLTHENVQSRLRGLLLMAISNSSGELLLTTGNKSELAVGYCTLYGDMCGAFNILKDLYKTQVFELANFINRESEIIPNRIITRPPSAELRPDQRDDDSLPPYEILDAILQMLIEGRKSKQDIIEAGYDEITVNQVIKFLKLSEYKRSQAPIGLKVSSLAFGRDWRMPITNKYGF
jgi:NAD+ synthase (glutamine-hydrolysing)